MIHKYRIENIQEGQIVFKDNKILKLDRGENKCGAQCEIFIF